MTDSTDSPNQMDKMLTFMKEQFEEVKVNFAKIDSRFTNLEDKVAEFKTATDIRFVAITDQLGSLSKRVIETNFTVSELSQRVQNLEERPSRSSTPDKAADLFSTPISSFAPQPQKPTSQEDFPEVSNLNISPSNVETTTKPEAPLKTPAVTFKSPFNNEYYAEQQAEPLDNESKRHSFDFHVNNRQYTETPINPNVEQRPRRPRPSESSPPAGIPIETLPPPAPNINQPPFNPSNLIVVAERIVYEKDQMHSPIDVIKVKELIDFSTTYNKQFPGNAKKLSAFISRQVLIELHDHERLLRTEVSTTMRNWDDFYNFSDEVLLLVLRRKVRPISIDAYERTMYKACSRKLRDNPLLLTGYYKETYPVVNLITDLFEPYDALHTEDAQWNDLENQPPDVFVNMEVKSKMLIYFTCYGVENARSWIYKIGHQNLKSMGSMHDLYKEVRKINATLGNESRKQIQTDQRAVPPMISSKVFAEVLDERQQQKFERGRDQNRASTPVNPTGQHLFDPKPTFPRSQQYANRNQFLEQPSEPGQLSLLRSQEDLVDRYKEEDRLERNHENNVFFAEESRRNPSRPSPAAIKNTTIDHSKQPCFDMLASKGCAQQNKKPTPCVFSHERKVLTAYQDRKHLISNWNEYLSPHLRNRSWENPTPQLHFSEQVSTPTVLTDSTYHPSMLKPSLSNRRELSDSDRSFSTRYGTAEDEEDGH